MNTLRVKGVAKKLGVTTSCVWKWTKNMKGFPQPFSMGPRVTVWDESSLDTWLAKTKKDGGATLLTPDAPTEGVANETQ